MQQVPSTPTNLTSSDDEEVKTVYVAGETKSMPKHALSGMITGLALAQKKSE